MAWLSHRCFFAALGWILGVPLWLTMALIYNYATWGTFGTSPTIP